MAPNTAWGLHRPVREVDQHPVPPRAARERPHRETDVAREGFERGSRPEPAQSDVRHADHPSRQYSVVVPQATPGTATANDSMRPLRSRRWRSGSCESAVQT